MSINPNAAADAFLLGGGGKSATFESIGDTVTGTIVGTPTVQQQTDLATGKPKVWDNGDPIQQLVVRLQTSERVDGDDDGVRALYVKGSKKAGSRSLHDAVASAVRAAGARGLEEGGTLTVTHDGTEPAATRGFSDRKLYTATYAKPDGAAANGGFLGTAAAQPTAAAPLAQPQQQAQAPVQQPVQQQQTATPDQPSPEALAAFMQWQANQQQAG